MQREYANDYWRGEKSGDGNVLLLAADENFNSAILRGLLRVRPDLDLVSVQDVGPFIAETCQHAELEGQIIYLPLSK